MNYIEAVKNYQNNVTSENLEKQVELLLKEMKFKEKIYMLSGHGIGQTSVDIIRTGRNYNVRALPAGGCKRLGIPAVRFTDGPRGVVMGNSTCLPVSILRASAFDESIEYRAGKLIADEAIAQGANYFAGVCINVLRNPRWGRSQESYGEDTYLLGQYGAALTRSVQEEGMIACPKHFALNSIEDLRFYVDVETDDKTLYEIYLPHFKKCVDAGAQSMMGAYNRYDGTYCCGNKKLLTHILREEWGFDGFVISDFVWGVRDTEDSLRAGLDIEMMFTRHYSVGKIKKALKNGKINPEHIDNAVKNILRVLIRQIPKIKPRDMSVVGSEQNRALAREIAEKGMVLLENNGALPLNGTEKIYLGGQYAATANLGDHGSSRVWSKNPVTPLSAFAKNGAKLTDKKDSDVCILCVGNDRKDEGEYFANTKYKMTTKPANCGGDRASLRIRPEDVQLIKSCKEAGKKVVVILFGGGVILTEEWREYADAIVMGYYSGDECGNALYNLLNGKVGFGGKLPFTVGKDENDYPPIIGIGQKPYVINYGYYHGYALFDKNKKATRYPFGYGLSYTKFEISTAVVTQSAEEILVKANIKNTGTYAGAEVLQVYVGGVNDKFDRPEKQLKGFKRVELNVGEEKTVEIVVKKEDIRYYDEGHWALDKMYNVYVGTHSCDNHMQKFTIEVE